MVKEELDNRELDGKKQKTKGVDWRRIVDDKMKMLHDVNDDERPSKRIFKLELHHNTFSTFKVRKK